MTDQSHRCSACRLPVLTASGLCEDCQRHAAIGTIVSYVVSDYELPHRRMSLGGLDVLEAIATLLGQVTRQRTAAMKAFREEERAIQLAMGDAHDEGYREGQQSVNEW